VVVLGLLFALLIVLLGVGAGLRQFGTLARVRTQPYMPDEDRRYFRSQARRRLIASSLLVVIGSMIAFYYLSGMDARMDSIPERNKVGGPPVPDDPQAEADRDFTKRVGFYWISVILMLGVVVSVAVVDFWATRKYWMARYKEIKADHETKLQRDLAVFRQRKLNDRAKGLRKHDDNDDTMQED
jgi:phosphatidylglycerophosphate synthase